LERKSEQQSDSQLWPNLLSSAMRSRSSPREKTFAVGILLAFVGLGALAFPNPSGFLRIAAGTCLVFGVLLYKGAFFARVWDRGLIGSLQKTPQASLWCEIEL